MPDEIVELIAIKRQAERQELAPERVAAWRARRARDLDVVSSI